MSWNGYPNSVKYFLIHKLKHKYNASTIQMNWSCDDDNLPKIWMHIPFLGKQSESLVKSCILKIWHYLNQPIKFIIIYNTKKGFYFISNKYKIPEMSCNNVVYQIACPGCNKTYIGKTDRCLHKRLPKHSTQHNTSAVAQCFLECEHAHFINDLYDQYDQLNDLPSSSNISTSIKNLIFNNYKILYTSKSTNTNKLLIIEALHIKFNKPELNSSKELYLFI